MANCGLIAAQIDLHNTRVSTETLTAQAKAAEKRVTELEAEAEVRHIKIVGTSEMITDIFQRVRGALRRVGLSTL